MKVIVDVDGVLANVDSVLDSINVSNGTTITNKEAWGIHNANIQGVDIGKEIMKFYRNDELLYNLPIMDGAKMGMFHLYSRHYVIICTNRSKKMQPTTEIWLAKNGIKFHEYMSVRDKARVNADVMIDDSPHNILPWVRTGRKAYVFDHPWNEGLKSGGLIERVYSWRNLMQLL